MTTLTMRPHRGKADLDAIAPFLKTCEAVDLPNEYPSVSDILMQFDAPSVDQQRDIRLWEDAEVDTPQPKFQIAYVKDV